MRRHEKHSKYMAEEENLLNAGHLILDGKIKETSCSDHIDVHGYACSQVHWFQFTWNHKDFNYCKIHQNYQHAMLCMWNSKQQETYRCFNFSYQMYKVCTKYLHAGMILINDSRFFNTCSFYRYDVEIMGYIS